MPQDIQILPIAEEHIEGFHKCLDVVARERQYLALVQAPPLDSTRASVLFNIANHVPRFVAVISNDIVGWCDIFPLKHEGFQHRGELGRGVHPHYRGLGIGQQLANRTIQQARANGLERIELEVFASNIPAIKLYEKLGFITEGIKKKARKIDGNCDDIIEMVLFVRPHMEQHRKRQIAVQAALLFVAYPVILVVLMRFLSARVESPWIIGFVFVLFTLLFWRLVTGTKTRRLFGRRW